MHLPSSTQVRVHCERNIKGLLFRLKEFLITIYKKENNKRGQNWSTYFFIIYIGGFPTTEYQHLLLNGHRFKTQLNTYLQFDTEFVIAMCKGRDRANEPGVGPHTYFIIIYVGGFFSTPTRYTMAIGSKPTEHNIFLVATYSLILDLSLQCAKEEIV